MAQFELGSASGLSERGNTRIATFEGHAIRSNPDQSVSIVDINDNELALVHLAPGQWLKKILD